MKIYSILWIKKEMQIKPQITISCPLVWKKMKRLTKSWWNITIQLLRGWKLVTHFEEQVCIIWWGWTFTYLMIQQFYLWRHEQNIHRAPFIIAKEKTKGNNPKVHYSKMNNLGLNHTIEYCSEIENYSSMHQHGCGQLYFPKMATAIYPIPYALLSFLDENDMNIRSSVIVLQVPEDLFTSIFGLFSQTKVVQIRISIVLSSSSQILLSHSVLCWAHPLSFYFGYCIF